MLSVVALVSRAEAQHGVVTIGQLAACGFSRRAVARLCRTGWLRPVRRGAYAVGGRPPSPWDQAVAVALMAGPDAALSHYTAAAIHRLPVALPDEMVDVTVLRPAHPRLAGVRVHRVDRLPALHVAHRSGVRVTTPSRTLVDIAHRLEDSALTRLIDEGCVERLWTATELLEVAKGVPAGGKGHLSRLLKERVDDRGAESFLEQEVVRALQPLMPFEVHYQLVLDGHVVILDIAWPRWRVAVESDGWQVRGKSRSKFDHDRRKANLLAAHGWTVIHVTSAMSSHEILTAVARVLPFGGQAVGQFGAV